MKLSVLPIAYIVVANSSAFAQAPAGGCVDLLGHHWNDSGNQTAYPQAWPGAVLRAVASHDDKLFFGGITLGSGPGTAASSNVVPLLVYPGWTPYDNGNTLVGSLPANMRDFYELDLLLADADGVVCIGLSTDPGNSEGTFASWRTHSGNWSTVLFDPLEPAHYTLTSLIRFSGTIYVGGSFQAGVDSVRRIEPNGSIFRMDFTNMLDPSPAYCLHTFDIDGEGANGEQLLAGGRFHYDDNSQDGLRTGVMRWTGQEWVPVGTLTSGAPGCTPLVPGTVHTMTTYRGRLVIGGVFNLDTTNTGIWNVGLQVWEPLGVPQPGQHCGKVYKLYEFNDMLVAFASNLTNNCSSDPTLCTSTSPAWVLNDVGQSDPADGSWYTFGSNCFEVSSGISRGPFPADANGATTQPGITTYGGELVMIKGSDGESANCWGEGIKYLRWKDRNPIDYNQDGSVFDPSDIDDMLSVYSEGPCQSVTHDCLCVDMNCDGSAFDPADIQTFLDYYGEVIPDPTCVWP